MWLFLLGLIFGTITGLICKNGIYIEINKDKIKELKEKIEYLEKENKVVRIFKENMPEDTEIVVITKENYEKNFKKED